MSISKSIFRFPWRSRAGIAADVDDELRFHVDMRAAELIAGGMSEGAARAEALREFGDLERTRQYCRDADLRGDRAERRTEWFHQLAQDLRFGARSLRKQPAFTLVAILTLALGTGATTAIFSAVNAVLIRPLPFADPSRLAMLWPLNAKTGSRYGAVSPIDVEDWTAAKHQIASFGGYWYQEGASGLDLTGLGDPRRLDVAFVTEDFFKTLGVGPERGRVPRPDEMVRGANDHLVVLSDAFWHEQFGGAASAVGRTLTLDGEPYRIVGVMPPSFTFPAARGLDVWVPASTVPDNATPRTRRVRWMRVVARLAPGATIAGATREMTTITARLAQQYPENKNRVGTAIVPLRDAIVGDVRTALLVLFAAVSFVLLIACANVANLLLARATVRAREMALRTALGASRGRIVRQLLTESLLLAAAGGVLGLLLAWGATALAPRLAGPLAPLLSGVRVDGSVLLFALGATVVTGILFGAAPALRAASPRIQNMLNDDSRTATGRSGRARGLLVVAEVALAVVLVAGAGLMAKSFTRLVHVDAGFRAEHVVAVNLTLAEIRHPYPAQLTAYYIDLIDRVRAVPGVQSAGAVRNLPLRGAGESWPFTRPDRPVANPADAAVAIALTISPGYFATIGAPILAGRDITFADRTGTPPVILINETMAQQLWPGESAVGKSVLVGSDAIRVVGVVGDIRQNDMAGVPRPAMYVPELQNPRVNVNIVARVNSSPTAMLNAIRRAIWSVDRDQPITSMTTLDDVLSDAVTGPRSLSVLLDTFAMLGLTLGMIGLYGVLGYSVVQRQREMGVRIALGAQRSDVVRLVLRSALALSGTGVVIGIAIALVVGRLIRARLFDVGAADPAVFIGTAVLLLAVATTASYLPARRATKVDPVVALRAD